MELPVTTNSLDPHVNEIGKITIGDAELTQIFEESIDGAEYKISFAYKKETHDDKMPTINDIVEVMLVRGDV